MKKIKKYIILLFIVSLLGITLSLTMTFAKYVKDIVWDYHLKSQGFYFSSLELNSDGKENIINDWDGGSISFNLSNSVNPNLITNYDILYNVNCRVIGEAALYANCYLNDQEVSEVTGTLTAYETCVNNTLDGIDTTLYNKTECELGNYLWQYQTATSILSFNIVTQDPEYDLDNITVSIEASSTSPYVKTLKGNFVLYKNKSEELIIKYSDFQDYGKLIFSNFLDNEKCLNIKWDTSDLIIEENIELYNSYLLDEGGYINEINIDFSPKTALELTFHKRSSNDISIESFIISNCI